MEELGDVFRQRHLSCLKIPGGLGKHFQLHALARFEQVRRAEADQDGQRHRQAEEGEGRDPDPVHLLVGAQIGDADDDRGEDQRHQHHAQQVEKQRADQLGAIQGVLTQRCRSSNIQPEATGNAEQATDQDLAIQ